MRLLLRYILFLLLPLAQLTAQNADPPVKPDSSTWWYPLGNMEGTRRNPAPTLADGPDDLVVKWRTTALRNSRTILVGAMRPEQTSDFTQQIVGIVQDGPLDQMATTDTVVVVNDHGFVDWKKNYFPTVLSTPHRLTLTGLFNYKNRTPMPIGRPTTIGIGVERVTPEAPSKVFAILANPKDGAAIQEVGVSRVEDGDSNNRRVAVYPVALFTPYGEQKPILLALSSQNTFHVESSADRNANKLYKYRLDPNPDSIAAIPIAPKTYPQAPGLHTSRNDSLHYIGISTATIPGTATAATIPGTGITTSSALQYSIDVQIPPLDLKDSLRLIEARELPKGTPGIKSSELRGETDTYFLRMFFDPSDDTVKAYRVMTTNHDAAHPGVPVMMFSDAEQALETPLVRLADTNVRNVGWTIVAADVDGTDRKTSDTAHDGLINNPGDELLAAYRNIDGSDLPKNTFQAFKRRQNPSIFANGALFGSFVRWNFSGRLMAAADLVRDDKNRQEVVIVDVDTLHIYQLKPYDELWAQHGDNLSPFNEVKSFILDSRIVSVAVADLHGTGYNDLIVTTERATYAIGRPIPQPLGTVAIADTEYCPGSTATITWGPRIVGGGEDGVTVMLRDVDGKDSVLQDGYQPQASTGTFSFNTGKLPLGEYRIVVSDKAVPNLTASGGTFRIVAPSIQGVKLPQDQYGPGDVVTFTTKYRCADHLVLERSDSSADAWYSWPAVIDYDTATSTATVSTTISCFDPCRTSGQTRIFFRLRDTMLDLPPSESDRFTFTMPDRTIGIDTVAPRIRRVAWIPGQFDCDSVHIAMSLGGTPLNLDISAAAETGFADVELPRGLSGNVSVRVCCGDDVGNPCDYGLGRFEVEPLEPGNYVQPNPFDPNVVEGASIFYTLDKASPVTVTIFDASRALVRKLITGADRDAGLNIETWDGRNSLGEIVANGTYICIIESGSGRLTPLPIFIMKH